MGDIVAEGFGLQYKAMSLPRRREIVAQALTDTGLDPAAMDRYRREFSGGQRQRIEIARAIVLEPKFIVLDRARAGFATAPPRFGQWLAN